MSPLPILSFSESRKLDLDTLQGGTVSGFELMQCAGEAMAEEIKACCLRKKFSKEILLLAGKGNNGGDAFVVALKLFELGLFPTVVLAHPREGLIGDALLHFVSMEKAGVPILEAVTGKAFRDCLKRFSGDIVVDGLLGTGFHPPLLSLFAEIIQGLNESDFWVVSLDLPSGMNDLGDSLCVRSDLTLSVGSFKTAFLSPRNVNVCGKVIPLDIGFPHELWKDIRPDFRVFLPKDLKSLLNRRRRNDHKGCFGQVLLVGGSIGCVGALVLAGLGALRSGCGLLTLASEANVRDILHTSLSESMTLACSKLDSVKMAKFDALGIGPGLGTSVRALKILKAVITLGRSPLVMDADALNLLASGKLSLKKSKRVVVLTPHPGEAARLLDCDVPQVEADRFKAAGALSEKFNAWVVLKGAHTVVCGPEGTLLHLTGTPAMASGGMGDVLTGMIVSFLAQGFSPWEACNMAVALQGLAAEALESEGRAFGILASEVANQVPCIVGSLGRLKK